MTAVYGADLAYIHDAAYGGIASAAAELLISELVRSGHRDGCVVDLGCGPGVLAERLVAAGYDVVGIDASAHMIARARARVPNAHFQVGSVLSAEIPRCVAVTAIGEVLSYGADGPNPRRARAALFKRVYGAMAPGGRVLLDVAGPTRVKPGGPFRTFAEGADWAVLVESKMNTARRILSRTITSFRQVGTLYRRSVEIHQLGLIEPDALLASLCGSGFDAKVIRQYGHAPLPEGVVAFIARKPFTGAGPPTMKTRSGRR